MFGRKESKETNGGYSPRSQRTWLRQRKLEQDLKKCEGLIGYFERSIADLERSKELMVRHRIETAGSGTYPLGRTLTELAEKGSELAVYKEKQGLIQSEIHALVNVPPQQAAERTDRQNHLAKIVAERVEKDRLVEGALNGLRRLLQERGELTAKVVAAASAVELTVNGDALDEQRFKLLSDSLPAELARTSERWASWFTADQEGMKSYAVVVNELTLPESLARANSYCFADRVELTDEESGELVRDVCPIGRARYDLPWTYEAPRIMPLEAFEALVREATDKGSSPQDLVSGRNTQREEQLKEQYAVEYQAALREHRQAERAAGRLMGGNPADD